ncbi:hypothetical protein INT47_010354 [Mucor saturninus]|uniref:Uncharacterized protein n=1 Tax=Mucor saturninus TaxID=64648 RepID=A0A8H7UNL3_9FUNG|nr:hypothetical protein INT47_010354 [Mucor saturninus]
MDVDNTMEIASATPSQDGPAVVVDTGVSSVPAHKRSVLGKASTSKHILKGPIPKLVVPKPSNLKGHNLFTKTMVAKKQ